MEMAGEGKGVVHNKKETAMSKPTEPGLHSGMRCIFCRVGQPVHLYKVTSEGHMLACEPCARRSGLERDDIDRYGESDGSETICPCCGQPGGVCQHCGSHHIPRLDHSCENCYNPQT